MNAKRWMWASVAVFAAMAISDFIIHGVLLSDLYRQTASVWRPPLEAQRLVWIFWIGYLVFAPLFTLVYAKATSPIRPASAKDFASGCTLAACCRC